jgi:Na+/H+-dicarboxylate symporter
MVFFGLTAAVYELRVEKKTLALYYRTIVYTALTSLGMIAVGIFLISILSPGRIPIIIEEQIPIAKPEIGALLFQVFPKNGFMIFAESGDFLLPLAFFALFLGLNLTFDRPTTRPVIEIIDALSRVFYHMNTFITEFIFIGCIALAGSFVFHFRGIGEINLFMELFLVLGLFSLIMAFVIFPGFLYFFCGKKTPFRWMYAQLGPALGALLSGDLYFSLGLLIRHGKESLGVPRRAGAITYPFLAVFGRGGSGMVTAVSFIVILRSYSSLEIGFFQLLWVLFVSFGVSFILGAVPGAGTLVGISLLSGFYGRGMEEGFLILKPIAPLLISLGAFLDAVSAAFISVLVSDRMKMTRSVEEREMI